jgi:glutamine cyclotransferase
MKFAENIKFKYIFIFILGFFILSNSLNIQNNNNINSRLRNSISTNENNYLTIQNALLSNNEIKVLNIIKKSPRVSTDSLFYDNGIIYESGLYKNKSFLLKKDFKTNKIIKTIPLLTISGKGIAKCGENFYQLTEKEKKVLKYTYPNLDLISTFPLDNDMIKG